MVQVHVLLLYNSNFGGVKVAIILKLSVQFRSILLVDKELRIGVAKQTFEPKSICQY